MEVQVRVRRVISGTSVLGDEIIVQASVDLELAAVPGQDLGLDAREGVRVALGELDAVLLCSAGEDFQGEARAIGDFEAPFPCGSEYDGARR